MGKNAKKDDFIPFRVIGLWGVFQIVVFFWIALHFKKFFLPLSIIISNNIYNYEAVL